MQSEIPVNFGQIDDGVGLVGRVEYILDELFLEHHHFFMGALRVGGVELLKFSQKLTLLGAHLLYVLYSPQDAANLFHQVLAFLDRQHILYQTNSTNKHTHTYKKTR